MSKPKETGHNKIFLIVSGVLTFAILIGGVLLLSKKDETTKAILPPPTIYEYYWSKTCPHCAKVNEFMSTWEGKDKIEITKYEVNETKENASRFVDRGTYCHYPRQELGVPFLVTPGGLCLAGDEPIINHFRSLNLD